MSALPAAALAQHRVPLRWTAWLAWRQQRAAIAAVCAAAAVLGVPLVLDLAKLGHANALGLRACVSGAAPYARCAEPLGLMDQVAASLIDVKVALLVLPALIGAFAGAPFLAREHETGTFRYTRTQGLAPWRWLLLSMTCAAVPVAVLTAADGTLFDIASGLLSPGSGFIVTGATFPAQAPALPAWSVLAYALGVASGAVIRRTLPAMAVTLGGYGAVYYLTKDYLRSGYRHIAFWARRAPHAGHFWLYQGIEAGWLLLAALVIALAVICWPGMATAITWRRREGERLPPAAGSAQPVGGGGRPAGSSGDSAGGPCVRAMRRWPGAGRLMAWQR